MKKPFVIEYRNNPSCERDALTELFPDEWEKFKSYVTERARNQALESYQHKFDFLEFRPRLLTKDAADWAYFPEKANCFWCGKPATYIIGIDKLFACEEHGSQAESNGWTIYKHKDAQPLI